MSPDLVVIHSDGCSKGNPGPAAIGATIKDEAGKLLITISQTIGHATNNQAEYRAAVAALTEARRLGAHRVNLYSDSELMVKQLRGEYRVKNQGLKPLQAELIKLTCGLQSFTVKYIPREQNREADALANKALGL